ncbi:MAG: PHP domain-containing protein [Chloroflexi bacterium]|nr:PHP domain-containing protein [Chloroflexota bacterium]
MLIVEFHCHTNASGDSLVRPADLVKTCRDRGIDRVIITDHNSIRGALEAQRIAPDMVIVGEEVMTTVGELLCAFVQEEVPAGLTPSEVIARLKDQGAFISVSHPFDQMRAPWFSNGLDEIVADIDAIEIFNARCLLPSYNRDATTYARDHGLAGTAGSDAHMLTELGKATTLLPEFEDADGLRRVISKAQYETRRTGLLARLGSRYAAFRKGSAK